MVYDESSTKKRKGNPGYLFGELAVGFIRTIRKKLTSRPIAATDAVFDTGEFLDKTLRLTDPFIREHALNVIQQGYTIVPNAVNLDLIDAANESYTAWKARNRKNFIPDFYKSGERLDRVVNLQAYLPEFRRLFSANRSLAVQDYLFQQQTVLYTSLFFEIGSTQDIHRDIPLFWTNPANMYFGTWTALEAADEDNGPLVVVPGSQRLPLLDRDAIARQKHSNLADIKSIDDDLWGLYQSKIASLCAQHGLTPQTVPVNKGDTLIWHPLLVHGGAKIRDVQRTRRSLVVHTIPKDVGVYQSDVFFNVNRKVNKQVRGQYITVDDRLLTEYNSLSIGHSHESFDFSQLR